MLSKKTQIKIYKKVEKDLKKIIRTFLGPAVTRESEPRGRTNTELQKQFQGETIVKIIKSQKDHNRQDK